MSTAVIEASPAVVEQGLFTDLANAQDMFDIAAACYYFIETNKGGDDATFVYGFDEFQKTKQSSKFLNALLELCNQDYVFFQFLQNLQELLKSFSSSRADLTYYALMILHLIDSMQSTKIVSDNYPYEGKLNQHVRSDFCVVYPQETKSFLSRRYYQGNSMFRRPLRHYRLGEMFRSILILPCSLLAGCIPKLYHINLTSLSADRLFKEKRFKIASIPFIGHDTFKFRDPDTDGEIEDHSRSFYISYDSLTKEDENRFWGLLSKAIASGANIIVFPEYIFKPSLRKKLQDFLKNGEYPELWLVIAGTSLEYNKETRKNCNTMQLFTGRGIELPGYTKHTAFLSLPHELVHGVYYGASVEDEEATVTETGVIPSHIEKFENLSNAPRSCVLIDIEGVGRVLPAVCRDIIEGDYTRNLAEMFMPSMLLIPAWSTSVSSFTTPLKQLADSLHITSLLCNCCNAVKRKTTLGMFVMPRKVCHYMHARITKLHGAADCTNICSGCIHMITFSYGGIALTSDVQHIPLDISDGG